MLNQAILFIQIGDNIRNTVKDTSRLYNNSLHHFNSNKMKQSHIVWRGV